MRKYKFVGDPKEVLINVYIRTFITARKNETEKK